jgi:hypothetical protein
LTLAARTWAAFLLSAYLAAGAARVAPGDFSLNLVAAGSTVVSSNSLLKAKGPPGSEPEAACSFHHFDPRYLDVVGEVTDQSRIDEFEREFRELIKRCAAPACPHSLAQ